MLPQPMFSVIEPHHLWTMKQLRLPTREHCLRLPRRREKTECCVARPTWLEKRLGEEEFRNKADHAKLVATAAGQDDCYAITRLAELSALAHSRPNAHGERHEKDGPDRQRASLSRFVSAVLGTCLCTSYFLSEPAANSSAQSVGRVRCTDPTPTAVRCRTEKKAQQADHFFDPAVLASNNRVDVPRTAVVPRQLTTILFRW